MLNLIHHLPQASHYFQAVANDEEHVELLLKATEGQPETGPVGPPMSEWTATVDKLAGVQDTLGQILSVSIAAAGGKPGKPQQALRPPTKFDSVRARKLEAKRRRVMEMVTIEGE